MAIGAGLLSVVIAICGVVATDAPTARPSIPTVARVSSNAPPADELRERRAIISRDLARTKDGVASVVTGSALARAEERRRQAWRTINRSAQRRGRELAQRAARRAADQWSSPMSSYRITARFGSSSSLWSTTHTGLDLAAPQGVPIRSVARGVVTSAGYDGSYGNKVVVRHADGTETWYAHMSSLGTTAGSSVTRRSVLGTVGSTGNVTGPHLHLEVRPGGGAPVDPFQALAERGVRL